MTCRTKCCLQNFGGKHILHFLPPKIMFAPNNSFFIPYKSSLNPNICLWLGAASHKFSVTVEQTKLQDGSFTRHPKTKCPNCSRVWNWTPKKCLKCPNCIFRRWKNTDRISVNVEASLAGVQVQVGLTD